MTDDRPALTAETIQAARAEIDKQRGFKNEDIAAYEFERGGGLKVVAVHLKDGRRVPQ